jgi:hypothetical protein
MLSTKNLAELKIMAKGRGIFQYYILPKDELIALLEMPDLPTKHKMKKMTIVQMRALAKERGLRGFWELSKKDLTRVLFPEHHDTIQKTATHQKQEDHSKTTEHEDPQNQHPNNVGVELVENA